MLKQSPLLAISLLAAVTASFAAGPASRPAPLPAVPELLDQQLPEVSFDGVPLDKALKSLDETSRLSIIPNWADLAAAGVKRDTPIRFAAKRVKASEALRQVLLAAGPGARYGVEHNVVYVATQKELSRRAFAIGKAEGDANANRSTAQLMSRVAADVKLNDVQVGDALDLCRDKFGIQLDVDWESLKKSGIERDLRVTEEFHRISAGDLIYWILRPLPAKSAIQWSLNGGKFKIVAEAPRPER